MSKEKLSIGELKRKYWDYESDDIFKCSSTYLDNRFLDENYHKRMMMRKEQDPEGYQIYGLGEWGRQLLVV